MTFSRRESIARAACRQVAYDLGYSRALAHTSLPIWYGSINDLVSTGENPDPLSPSHAGSSKYLEAIDENHPGYIRELYRYAERTIGPLATWRELADTVNFKSAVPGEERPTLSVSRRQLAAWFAANNGKEVSAIEKPLLTSEHRQQYVCNRLVMGYETYTAGGNKKWKPLNENDVMDQLGVRTDSEGNQIPLELRDLELFVQQAAGDEVDEDVSCDSTFMLEKIPAIGGALREKFHWVPENETIYLFMDNAGGHGTNDAIQEYTNRLWADYKVQIVWQVPRSPETNMLDLGVWMSIQAAVTRVHYMRRCHHDALARSVEEAWNSYLSPLSFERVHRRLRVVLTCIVDDKGGNELVESKRGKLFRDATIIDLTDDGEEEGANANLIDDLEDLVDEDEV